MKASIIILAAGESRRLGQPKQLVEFRGETLIERTVAECITSELGDVHVICGANYNAIYNNISHLNCTIHRNEHWRDGLGSSIAYGVTKLSETDINGVFLALSDQPYFNSLLLRNMNELIIDTKSLIVVSRYGNQSSGPPTYFDRSLFDELTQLKNDEGAKSIVQKYKNEISYIEFLGGEFDIDTPADLEKLKLMKLGS